MKNTIRCCISCILPCGSLDVIRIVHANGQVEEISGAITAAEVMKLHSKHVLKKPSSSSDGVCPKIVVVPPDAKLQRGKIYFLIPLPPAPERNRSRSSSSSAAKRKKKDSNHSGGGSGIHASTDSLLTSDRYLTEILSEKVFSQRDRRRSRAGIWRPHLESICETPSDTYN